MAFMVQKYDRNDFEDACAPLQPPNEGYTGGTAEVVPGPMHCDSGRCVWCRERVAGKTENGRQWALIRPHGLGSQARQSPAWQSEADEEAHNEWLRGDTALRVPVCDEVCAAQLVGAPAGEETAAMPIGAVFLFDITIRKLRPITALPLNARNQLILPTVTDFQEKPVGPDSQTRGRLHLEFFSPNTRVRTLDRDRLAVTFNRQSRRTADSSPNAPVYARQFTLETGPAARVQVRLADFFNKKEKPRYVRLSGLPTAAPDLKRRLTEGFRLVAAAEGEDVAVPGKRHYAAQIGVPAATSGAAASASAASDPKARVAYLVLEFDGETQVLERLYAIEAPRARVPELPERKEKKGFFSTLFSRAKNLFGGKRKGASSMTNIYASIVPTFLQAEMQPVGQSLSAGRPGADWDGGDALIGADFEDLGASSSRSSATGTSPSAEQDTLDATEAGWLVLHADATMGKEETERLQAALVASEAETGHSETTRTVGSAFRVLSRAKIRPLFSVSRFQRGALLLNAITDRSFKLKPLVSRLEGWKRQDAYRDSLWSLMRNDLFVVQSAGEDVILSRWAKQPQIANPQSAALAATLYGGTGATGFSTDRQTLRKQLLKRRNPAVTVAEFGAMTKNVWTNSDLEDLPDGDVRSDGYRAVWDKSVLANETRRIAIIGGDRTDDYTLYLDDFYSWTDAKGSTESADITRLDASAAQARIVDLRLSRGEGGYKPLEMTVRLNGSYQDVVRQSNLVNDGQPDTLVVLGDTTPLDTNPGLAKLTALVFRGVPSSLASGRRWVRWRLDMLVDYQVRSFA